MTVEQVPQTTESEEQAARLFSVKPTSRRQLEAFAVAADCSLETARRYWAGQTMKSRTRSRCDDVAEAMLAQMIAGAYGATNGR